MDNVATVGTGRPPVDREGGGNVSKPIDFADMLNHIAAARGCPEPNQAQIGEMERALRNIRPDAVRAAVADWLRTDTQAIKRLPYPGELLPGAQQHARVLALQDARPPAPDALHRCPDCEDTRWIDAGTSAMGYPTVRPCQRCLPATFSRWRRGHLDPNHQTAGCQECDAVRTGKAVSSAIASEVDPDPQHSIWNRTARRQEPAA